MDKMDAYAEPIAEDIEAKSESWFHRQAQGIADGFQEVGRDAWNDIGNSYQSILTQDAGWQAQWNARGMYPGTAATPAEGDTITYVGVTETHVNMSVYVGLSEEIGQQQEAADIAKGMEPSPEPQQEPEFHI
jgi:hypothetical protein